MLYTLTDQQDRIADAVVRYMRHYDDEVPSGWQRVSTHGGDGTIQMTDCIRVVGEAGAYPPSSRFEELTGLAKIPEISIAAAREEREAMTRLARQSADPMGEGYGVDPAGVPRPPEQDADLRVNIPYIPEYCLPSTDFLFGNYPALPQSIKEMPALYGSSGDLISAAKRVRRRLYAECPSIMARLGDTPEIRTTINRIFGEQRALWWLQQPRLTGSLAAVIFNEAMGVQSARKG